MPDTIRTSGGVPASALAMVTADQRTILGNGTTEQPLRTGSPTSDFEAEFSNPLADPNEPRVGNAVVVATTLPGTGFTTVVRTGSAGLGSPQLPYVIGILVEAGDVGSSGGSVSVRSSGPVTLTTAQWDLITGSSGGLTRGSAYYLDWGFNSFGKLTSTKPSASGMAISQIGVALNPTTMLVSLPAVPTIIA